MAATQATIDEAADGPDEAAPTFKFIDRWKLCPRRNCRRRRRCVTKQEYCSNLPPRTEQQQDKALRRIERLLQRELARRGMTM